MVIRHDRKLRPRRRSQCGHIRRIFRRAHRAFASEQPSIAQIMRLSERDQSAIPAAEGQSGLYRTSTPVRASRAEGLSTGLGDWGSRVRISPLRPEKAAPKKGFLALLVSEPETAKKVSKPESGVFGDINPWSFPGSPSHFVLAVIRTMSIVMTAGGSVRAILAGHVRGSDARRNRSR